MRKAKIIQGGSIYDNYHIYDKVFNQDAPELKKQLLKKVKNTLDLNTQATVLDLLTGRGEYLFLAKKVFKGLKVSGLGVDLNIPTNRQDIIDAGFDFVKRDVHSFMANRPKTRKFDIGLLGYNALQMVCWDEYIDVDGNPYFDATIATRKMKDLIHNAKKHCDCLVIEMQSGRTMELDKVDTLIYDYPESDSIFKEHNLDRTGVEVSIEEHFLFTRNAYCWQVKAKTTDGYIIEYDPIWRSNIQAPQIFSMISTIDYENVIVMGSEDGDHVYDTLASSWDGNLDSIEQKDYVSGFIVL